jgi:oxygen-independent coproporphyrinogen-3 oxidase
MALLFGALRDHTGKTPRWGMLTGIHPIKLLRQLTERFGAAEAEAPVPGEVFCLGGKGGAGGADAPLAGAGHGGCRGKRLRAVHLGALLPDALRVLLVRFPERRKDEKADPAVPRAAFGGDPRDGGLRRQLGLRLRAVYVGGGTPTTFSAEQLRSMLETVRASFDLSACTEFTVEAGRPDTIDRES